MEKNNHPDYSSRCTKFRKALANSIHRISYYHHQEPSGSPVPQPRHIRGNHIGDGNGAVPIKFVDHHHPNQRNFNGPAQVVNRIEPERPHYGSVNRAATNKGEEKGEQKDMNYIFGEYITRAREKLRTVSNIGKAHQNKPAQDEAGLNVVAKKKDAHKDQISDFISRTKKKIRTTSSIRFGKNDSLRRG